MAYSPFRPGGSGPSPRQSFVYVRSLPESTRVEDLKRVFAQFGQVDYVQINTNDLGSIAKIQFDSHQSASAAVENPPLNLSVGFDKKFNSIKNNFVGKNNVRINNRYSPALVESREAVGQYQVVPDGFRWPASSRLHQTSNDPHGCFVQPILLQVTVPQPNSNPSLIEALEKCALCGRPTSIRCSICKTQYCSAQCQSDHWPIHKTECSKVPPAEKIESASVPQRSMRRPLVPPAPLRHVQEKNLQIETADERPIPPNREINLRGSTLTGHNPTSPTYQNRAQNSVPLTSSPIAGTPSGDTNEPVLTDGSALSPQLYSQLDDTRVGDDFIFQPKFLENENPNFEAVFIEELTLSRIAYKMQDFCENLKASDAFLKATEIVTGKLLIVYDNMDGKDCFKRAFVTKIIGETVQVVLIDYARVRLYPSSAPVFLDALSQLNKYRSCGVWFEVVSYDQKKFVLGHNEISRAKIVRKHICSNSRTDFVEVTVMDAKERSVASFRVHPWYKLDRLASSLLVPELEFRELIGTQSVGMNQPRRVLLPPPPATGLSLAKKEEVVIASNPKPLLANAQTVAKNPDLENQPKSVKHQEEFPVEPVGVKDTIIQKPEPIEHKNLNIGVSSIKPAEVDQVKQNSTVQLPTPIDSSPSLIKSTVDSVQPVPKADSVEIPKLTAIAPKAVEPSIPNSVALEPVKPTVSKAVEPEKSKIAAEVVNSKAPEKAKPNGNVPAEKHAEATSRQDVKLAQVALDPEKIKLPDLATTKFVQGDVLEASGLDEFTNRLIVSKPAQDDILNMISEILTKEPKISLKGNPEKLQIVSCKWAHEGDNEYYRAVVTSVNPSLRKVKVQFIDYGNRSTENFDALSPLPQILSGKEFPCTTAIVHLAGVPEKSVKLEPDGYDRMLAYLGTVGPSFVVAKIEEVNGVQFYTLATTSGQVINDNLKNVLLGIEPTVAAQPQTALGEFVYDPKKSQSSLAMDFGKEIAVTKLSADSPFGIYVFPNSRTDEFVKICELVAEKSKDLMHIKGYEPKIGNLCVAKASDGEMYRAVPKERTPEGFSLFFPDYGFEELITCENIYPISSELASLGFVSTRCVLDIFAELESSADLSKVIDFGSMVHLDESEFTIKPLRFTSDGSGVVISIMKLSPEVKLAIENIRKLIDKNADDETAQALKAAEDKALQDQLAAIEEMRMKLIKQMTK